MEIIKSLNNSKIVLNFEVIELKTFKTGFYLKIKAILKDKSELFIREYSDENIREYSYHWQSENKTDFIRWDNATHHREIKTYPHHKHINDNIYESKEITVSDVLKYLE
jgi:hypothetical protein